jgi:hypothetical protein
VIFYPITAILGMKILSTGMLTTLENYMTYEQPKNTAEIYEIKLQGHLDTKWSEWFYGMTITHERDGTTTLYGPLPDQIVLHSVLDRIRDMNLPLISVKQIVSDGLTRNDEAEGVSQDE